MKQTFFSKFGEYRYHDGNNCINLFNSHSEYPGQKLENITVIIDDGTLEITGTEVEFKRYWDAWWRDSYETYFNLEGKTLDQITELKFRTLSDWLHGKKSRKLKNDILLRLAKEEKFYLKTSNWTFEKPYDTTD